MNETEINQLVIRAVRQILGEPNRYGLIWRMLPATVLASSFGESVSVHMDGDDDGTTLAVVSLIGNVLAGARVMVCFVPPSGAYIIGQQPSSPARGYRPMGITLTYNVAGNTTITRETLLGARGLRQRLWGGGGGGGGCSATGAGQASVGAGGGGGGYSETFIDLSTFSSATLTVGIAGTAGPTGGNGGDGGDTIGIDGSTGAGGGGGEGDAAASSGAVSTAGGSGGGAGGDITINGGDGGNGVRNGGFVGSQGFGGTAGAGAGNRRGTGSNAAGPGVDGRVYGGGGSGGSAQPSQAAQVGGAGAVGLAVLELYI